MSRENLEQSRMAVERVVRSALAASCEPLGSEVPLELVRAVTEGSGDREVVGEIARTRLRAELALDLVLFDTDRIAEYVFESSRPPVIRGASKLLEDLNTTIRASHRDFVLYSGGGEGLLLVPAGRGEGLCRTIEEAYDRETAGALGVTTGWLNLSPADFVAESEYEPARVGEWRLVSGTPAVLARLRDDVRQKKDAKRSSRPAVDGSARRCVSCRDRAASVPLQKYRPEEPASRQLCQPCDRRWSLGRELIRGVSVADLVEDYATALDVGEVEGSAARDLGFLYADGNAMGALFSELHSLSELCFLSGAVRELFQRLEGRVKARLAELTKRPIEQVQLLSLLSGGDEAMWLLPAAAALEVATRLPGWLELESRALGADLEGLLRRAGLERLTVGMGLVICDPSYPVRAQYRLARALQKNAKKRFYESASGQADSVLDFEIVPAGSPLAADLDGSRRRFYATDEADFLRTCRPYRAAELDRLRRRLEAAQRHQLARGVWYGLQDAAREGRAIFLNFFRYQLARDGLAAERLRAWLVDVGVDPFDAGAVEGFLVDGAAGSTWISDVVELARYWELEGRH